MNSTLRVAVQCRLCLVLAACSQSQTRACLQGIGGLFLTFPRAYVFRIVADTRRGTDVESSNFWLLGLCACNFPPCRMLTGNSVLLPGQCPSETREGEGGGGAGSPSTKPRTLPALLPPPLTSHVTATVLIPLHHSIPMYLYDLSCPNPKYVNPNPKTLNR